MALFPDCAPDISDVLGFRNCDLATLVSLLARRLKMVQSPPRGDDVASRHLFVFWTVLVAPHGGVRGLIRR
jgi:hypothetical protein